MIKLAAFLALSLAGALLGLQIVLALEYTAGGTLGIQASAVLAMVSLAALPVIIEAARHLGRPGIGVALFVAFVAFLVYSLPATTGRTGEIKETKVTAAADVSRIRDDLERTSKSAEWARQDWITECGSGEGKRCRAKRNTVQALDDRKAKLEADIKAMGPAAGDMGSDMWAWASGFHSATVRKVSVLSFAVGIDVAIWALVWFAVAAFTHLPKAGNDNCPAVLDTAQSSFPITPPGNGGNRSQVAMTRPAFEAHVLRLVEGGKPLPAQQELADATGVPKGTVSKWLGSMESRGLIQRETVGRCKAVRAA